jgi:hypothetical protein
MAEKGAPEMAQETEASLVQSIVLKTGPVIEPMRLSVQVFTGRTTGSPVHCLVF